MRISHDTAFDDILMVFDNYVKNHNENNEFWKEIQVECKGNHYWEDGNSPCHQRVFIVMDNTQGFIKIA